MREEANKWSPEETSHIKYSKNERTYIEGLFGLHSDQANEYKSVLPNCFIIGAAKSGTTTLAATLRRHSGVFLSRPKEPKFFGPNYARGWAWYGDIFNGGEQKRVRIDASTRYTSADAMYLGTALLISNYIENPKIIYIVRNPLDRIVSHWRHIKGLHPKRDYPFNKILSDQHLSNTLLGQSMYFQRISHYRKYFPDERILCLTFEDMLGEPERLLRRVLEFLELSAHPRILQRLLPDGAFRQHNPAGASGRDLVAKPNWNPDVRREVINILSPDSRRFLEYAGKPTDFWPDL